MSGGKNDLNQQTRSEYKKPPEYGSVRILPGGAIITEPVKPLPWVQRLGGAIENAAVTDHYKSQNHLG